MQALPTLPPAPARFQHLCDEISSRLQTEPIPGAVLGVWHAGEERIAPFGLTSVDNPLPVEADTLFQVGSITKTVTATILLRLVEAGRLDLDQPVRRWLPHLRLQDEDTAARVTLRHLLTHTGGWVGDYFNDLGPGPEALGRVVAEDLPTLPQVTPLGTLWSYCNSGFYIAARLIETASDSSFEEAAERMVFSPLGMRRAYFFPHDLITYRFASGHAVVDHRPVVARPWGIGRASHAVGGLVTTVADLLRYARFHLGDGQAPDGTRLLSRELLAQMQAPQVAAAWPDWMGLTWFITPLPDGRRVLRHGGATKGQMANLTFVPGEDFAYAMFANSDEAENLIYDIRRAALKAYLAIDLPELTPIEAGTSQLAELAGSYEAAMGICDLKARADLLELRVTWKGGFPTPDAPPPSDQPEPVRAALCAGDRILCLDAPFKGVRGEFLRNAEGRIAWFRFESRLHQRRQP